MNDVFFLFIFFFMGGTKSYINALHCDSATRKFGPPSFKGEVSCQKAVGQRYEGSFYEHGSSLFPRTWYLGVQKKSQARVGVRLKEKVSLPVPNLLPPPSS